MRICPCGKPSRYQDKASGQNRWCRDCKNKFNREDAKKSSRKEKRRDRHFRQTYGTNLEDVKRLSVAQGHVCAICKQPNRRRELAQDHNHTTNKNRGLLCDSCNLAIGLLKESPAILYRSIEYLNEWERIHNEGAPESVPAEQSPNSNY